MKAQKARNLLQHSICMGWVNKDRIFICLFKLGLAIYLCSTCIPPTQTEGDVSLISFYLNFFFPFCVWQQNVLLCQLWYLAERRYHMTAWLRNKNGFWAIFCLYATYLMKYQHTNRECCWLILLSFHLYPSAAARTLICLLSFQSCVLSEAKEVGLCMAGEYPLTELWIMAT